MVVFKNLNALSSQVPTWTNEDETSNNLPTVMQDGSAIPINNFGINVQTLSVYYWSGNEWLPTE